MAWGIQVGYNFMANTAIFTVRATIVLKGGALHLQTNLQQSLYCNKIAGLWQTVYFVIVHTLTT